MPKKTAGKIKNIWMLTREYDSIAGAGGVKDVSRQLAEALVRLKKSVTVMVPCYGFLNPKKLGFRKDHLSFDVDMNYTAEDRREHVTLWKRKLKGVTILLVDAERYREKRSIYTYTAEDEAGNERMIQGNAHFDYFAMNVLLQKTALDLMVIRDIRPDIIHCQDGHTAILPAMMHEGMAYRHYFSGTTGAVVTIHNAGHGHHQEVGDLPYARAICGLPYNLIHNNMLNSSFNPFLAASSFAVLNTVSENYAKELRETDDDIMTGWLGHRLMARGMRLEGITNGFNHEDFDTTKPKKLGLAAPFNPAQKDLAGKQVCRQKLIQKLSKKMKGISRQGSLEHKPEQPLFTLIGRLTAQKGVDILVTALDQLLQIDKEFQVLVLGTGARDLEQRLIRLTKKKENKGRACLLLGHDPLLANQIYAAGDFFLIPSRYEPCGLTDYMAQLAGNLPVVHHVGGLVKVEDGVTGFAFRDYSSDALTTAMIRAIRCYRESPDKIISMQQAAARRIPEKYSWDTIVHRYLELYDKALSMVN
jgi:starch synthase